MKTWKVTARINDFTEQKVIYVQNSDTKEDAESKAKRYFICDRPEIDFCDILNVEELNKHRS